VRKRHSPCAHADGNALLRPVTFRSVSRDADPNFTASNFDWISSMRLCFVAISLALLTRACVRQPITTESFTKGYDAQAADGIRRLRTATDAFHNLDSAVAAGYPREVEACIVHEHHGAMGYHHLNRAYVDGTLVPEHPQFLLYERRPDGSYRLNGAEFVLPYRFYSRDSTPPVFMGQKLAREDNFKYWYLHVWAWTKNPEGLFALFNPDVVCPEGLGQVYHPTPP